MTITTTPPTLTHALSATTGQFLTFVEYRDEKPGRLLLAEIQRREMVISYLTTSGQIVTARFDRCGKVKAKSFFKNWNEDSKTGFDFISEVRF